MRLTVLDLSRLLPGGYATHLLREMGARVIKVEDPVRGDYLREFPFPLGDGMSAYFHAINRGKESVAIDLKAHPEHLLKLAAHADVIVESFRPGVLDRLRVGYESVSGVNPRIIFCPLTGYGQSGPLRYRPGHDLNYVALSGLLDLNRGFDGQPAPPGLQIADVASGGLFAVARILQAVVERNETGRGQLVDVSMLEGTASLLTFTAAPSALAAQPVTWDDLLLNGQIACYNLYPTADGRWMAVGNLEEKFWAAFCKTVDCPEWNARQFDRSSEFRREVVALFRSKTQKEWVELFRDVDTCIEPVLTLTEAVERGLFRYPEEAAPGLGQDTERVFREFGI